MYTPSLSEDDIRKLYQLKQVEKRPMTFLINEAVEMSDLPPISVPVVKLLYL